MGDDVSLFGDGEDEKDSNGQVEAIRELNSEENIAMKTDLKKSIGEPHQFAKYHILAALLKWDSLEAYANITEKLKVSNDRGGRRESVEMVRSITPEEKNKNVLRRLMGQP